MNQYYKNAPHGGAFFCGRGGFPGADVLGGPRQPGTPAKKGRGTWRFRVPGVRYLSIFRVLQLLPDLGQGGFLAVLL